MHTVAPGNILAQGNASEKGDIPSVSVIQSYQREEGAQSEIDHRLKLAVANIEKELLARYPEAQAHAVGNRLRKIVDGLNYDPLATSLAIFTSPTEEKVAFLDIPVNDKIVIDKSFCIRDLIFWKKRGGRFLLLQLNVASSETWLMEAGSLRLINSNQGTKIPDTDPFLHRVEQDLTRLFKSYPLPVFVLGPENLLGRFSLLSHHSAHIVAYIHKDLPEASEEQLLSLLEPYITDWQRAREQNTLQHVGSARDAGKVIEGINAILEAASRKKTRLLVLEKDVADPGTQHRPTEDRRFSTRDNIDRIIQKVLEGGGDVEFVANGTLKAHGGMVLIPY